MFINLTASRVAGVVILLLLSSSVAHAQTAACCLIDESDDNNGDRMTCEECKALGDFYPYHGGLMCVQVDCSVCPFEDAQHGQGASTEFIFVADRAFGIMVADDFTPAASGLLSRVCYQHAYVPLLGGECSDEPADDSLEIHFYEDNFGLPGTELTDSPGLDVEWDSRSSQPGYRTWRYSAPIDPPVQVEFGECYWLSIMGRGRPDCTVHWTESRDGNNYRMHDNDGIWGYEDLRQSDYSWWVDIGIVQAVTPWVDGGCGDIEVACCRRDRSCLEGLLSECLADNGIFFPIDADPNAPLHSCVDVTCPGPLNDNCEDAIPICQSVCTYPVANEDCIGAGDPAACCTGAGSGTCNRLSSRWTCNTDDDCPDPDVCLPWDTDPDNGFCVNDDLLPDGPVCSRSAADCYDGSSCRPVVNAEVMRCFANKDNRLATTDGPSAGGACFASGENSFQADIWHRIDAPCTGIVVIDECRSQLTYDGMLAVFGDRTPEYADTACPITTNDDLLMCNDDFCPGSAVLSGVQANVVRNATYLLRSGGWSGSGSIHDASQGRATMNIGMICLSVPPPGPCVGVPEDPEHQARKNRYISMDLTTNMPYSVAYEITVAEMNRCTVDQRRVCLPSAPAGDPDACPNICNGNHDLQCSDDEMCGGFAPCIPSGPCGGTSDVGTVLGYIGEPTYAAGACFPNDDCDGQYFADVVSAPVYRIWTEETVHVTGCEISPAIVYEIRAVDQLGGSDCEPFLIGTVGKPSGVHYGDVAGPVTAGAFGPPDGFVSVIDVSCYLITNQGRRGSTVPAHTTWVDLHGDADETCDPGVPCVVPQGILNVSDLSRIKFGFIGKTYVETPGQMAPGDCP